MMANLEVIGKEDNDFIIKVTRREEPVRIGDTFAIMLPLVVTAPVIRNLTSYFYFLQYLISTTIKSAMADILEIMNIDV